MNSVRNFKAISVLLIIISFFFSQAVNVSAEEGEVARLDSANGVVEVKLKDENDFKPVAVGTIFKAQDTIRTSSNSRAAVLFVSGTILRLAPGTVIKFESAVKSESSANSLSMTSGLAHFFEREPKQLPKIETPAVTTAVRGTEFVIKVNSGVTEVSVLNGLVECTNSFGSQLAKDQEMITTKIGSAPVKSILVDPLDAVQWTLFYPDIVNSAAVNSSAGKTALLKAQQELASGQVSAANNSLDQVKQYLQSLPASKEKDELTSLMLAQRSVIATVKSQKEDATKLADQSWKLNESVSAAIANAYSFQAQGRLDDAKEWLDRALKLEPDNAFALARKAELNLGYGEIDEANELAQRALEIAPANPYVLSVAGFVYLIMEKREAATDAFKAAIQTGPGLGLPHLGYGLELIQQGDLKAGQKEIEMAVALEPNVAVYRSYLGKAFFEDKRESLAFQEYNNAIALDEQDPTPYLYRAFSQISANKSVEALKDVEKSIELNNNRAVYRSSLLLDQDLGVKSASLSEVFNDLGFSQAARVEAIKSINRDYGNYSAHRLLSGSYNTIFLDDAGIAETKIATLLAPLSFNLYSQGSGIASFNEYNSLFDRDQNQIQVSGEYQSDDNIFNPEVQFSGKENKFGYLISSDSLFTDEPGVGNDSRRYRTRAAFQYQPDYKDLFLVDGSALYRKAFNDSSAPDEVHADDYEVDIGYRHSFGPGSDFIVETTMSKQNAKYVSHSAERDIALTQQFEGQIDESLDTLLIDDTSREHINSIRNTAQWIYDSDLFSLVTGAQIYVATPDRKEDSPVLDDQQGIFTDLDYTLTSSGYNHLYSTDYYTYSTWHLASWADFNAGTSFTQVELEDREVTPFDDDTYLKSHLSPKVGFTFYPDEDLTIRSAYFETLRKSSLEDQASLEPTLVGGINQRFTDFSGDLSRTFGLGADYKVAASSYLGIEGLRRHVSDDIRPAISTVNLDYDTYVATNGVISQESGQLHQDQNIIRGYFYQVLSDRLVATFNSEWSKFERTDPDIPQDIKFNKNAIGLRYMDPQGWYLFSEATQRYQKLDGSDFVDDGSDNFWLVDAGLGYRLPEQHGAIQFKVGNIFDQNFTYDQSLGLEDFVRNDTNFILAFTIRN